MMHHPRGSLGNELGNGGRREKEKEKERERERGGIVNSESL